MDELKSIIAKWKKSNAKDTWQNKKHGRPHAGSKTSS